MEVDSFIFIWSCYHFQWTAVLRLGYYLKSYTFIF